MLAVLRRSPIPGDPGAPLAGGRMEFGCGDGGRGAPRYWRSGVSACLWADALGWRTPNVHETCQFCGPEPLVSRKLSMTSLSWARGCDAGEAKIKPPRFVGDDGKLVIAPDAAGGRVPRPDLQPAIHILNGNVDALLAVAVADARTID